MKLFAFSLVGILLTLVAGCAQYTVPGGKADFSAVGLSQMEKQALTDSSVRAALDVKPVATFPAALAVARIQQSGYCNQSGLDGYGRGNYSVILTREVETDADFQGISHLPQINGVVAFNRMLLPEQLNSDLELRTAAARLHADLLLLYTFDTTVRVDSQLQPLAVITLGLFPDENARMTTTASAILMDVANGYIYCVCEATSKDNQIANAWGSDQAMEDLRRRTEAEAFKNLVNNFKSEWPHVLAEYAPKPAAASAAAN